MHYLLFGFCYNKNVNKIKLVISLLSMPFLVACGSGKVEPVEYCTFTFSGTNCTLQGEEEQSFKIVKGETVNYTFVANEGCYAPEVEELPEGASYEKKDTMGIFSIEMSHDVDIIATSQIQTNTYIFHFEGTNCVINGDFEYEETGIPLSRKATYTINPLDETCQDPAIISIKNASGVPYEPSDYTFVNNVLAFNIETPEGIYVTAKSEKIDPTTQYQVIWNNNNGTSPIIESYNPGADLNKPTTPPIKDKTAIDEDGHQYAYTFTEWQWEGKQPGQELPDKVNQNYIFNAQYEINSIVTELRVENIEANDTIRFAVYPNAPKDFRVDWGNGEVVTGTTSHTYTDAVTGSSTIKIYADDIDCITIATPSSTIANKKIKSVVLSSTMSTIKNKAFSSLNLEYINIPYSITTIQDEAFSKCTLLKSVYFDQDNSLLTSIGESAFYNCSSLPALEIPKKVTEVGEACFINCSSLDNLTVNENNTVLSAKNSCIFKISGRDKIVVTTYAKTIIPTDEKLVFGPGSFADRADITEMTIGGNITKIDSRAFANCTNLKKVIFPANSETHNLTTLGDKVFSNCDSLYPANVIIPSSYLINVGAKIFSDCKLIDYILCDDDKSNILRWDSEWNDGKPIYLNVSYFGEENNVKFFVGADYRSEEALTYTYGYTGSPVILTIPNNYTDIGPYNETIVANSFANCATLTNVTIGNRVRTIGTGAFKSCLNLTEITLEPTSSLRYIEDQAFDSTAIETFSFASIYGIGQSAFASSNIKTVDFSNTPSRFTEIKDETFASCTSLTSVTFSNYIKTIGKSAFEYCTNLESIIIPSNITSIGNSAFNLCMKLKTVDLTDFTDVSQIESLTVGSDVFGACIALENIYVYDAATESAFKEKLPDYADKIHVRGGSLW